MPGIVCVFDIAQPSVKIREQSLELRWEPRCLCLYFPYQIVQHVRNSKWNFYGMKHSAEVPVFPPHILGLSLLTTVHIVHSLLIPVLSVPQHQPLSWGVTLAPAAALTQSLEHYALSRELKMEKTFLCRTGPSSGAQTLCSTAGSHLVGLEPAVSCAVFYDSIIGWKGGCRHGCKSLPSPEILSLSNIFLAVKSLVSSSL